VIEVHGTGNETREFLYADDAAQGMIAALENGKSGRAYNLGTNGKNAVSIRDLVSLIQEATGTEHKPVVFTGGEAGDLRRWSDSERIERETGWKHLTTLREGLRRTVKWYTKEKLAYA